MPIQPPADQPTTVKITRISAGGVAPRAFYPALAVIVASVVVTAAFPDEVGRRMASIQSTIVNSFNWYYVLAVAGFVVFAVWMGLSRFGDIKLGPDDARPDYSLTTWFAMLFGAGMGIGLVFWGAAEPLSHLTSPRPGTTGDDVELARTAMAQTFLHWGVHAWAIYVVVGLALAYAVHRKGRPLSIRWALEPLLGDRVRGWPGDLVDGVAIVGTVFGVATSLGLGVKQISAGLVHLGAIDQPSNGVLVLLIAAITLIATASVVSGVSRGIKWLANINIVLAIVFMVVVLVVGPTLFLLRGFVESFGAYLQNLVPLTFDLGAYRGDAGVVWQGAWTTFYWGWWISWAPFVGGFIAKISRGRTIREFVGGVLVVPAAVAFLWFAVMGGTAIHDQLLGDGGLVIAGGAIVSENVLFEMVADLPGGTALSVLALLLVVIFSTTPLAASSLVAGTLSSGGDPEPSRWTRVLFATLIGLAAVALLLTARDGSGLIALRTAAIAFALPFSLVMVALCVASYRAFRIEHQLLLSAQRRQQREEFHRHVTGQLSENFDDTFGSKIDSRIDRALAGIDAATKAATDERRADG